MKTEIEIIKLSISLGENNPAIDPIQLKLEKNKLSICMRCPAKDACFSCGCYAWWKYQSKQQAMENKTIKTLKIKFK